MKALNLPTLLKWLSLATIAAAFIVYATTDFSLGGSSPLGLLLVITGGWLLRLKEPIGGNLLLLFGGGSLLAFPFLFQAPFWYTLLAMPIAIYGCSGLLDWWQADED